MKSNVFSVALALLMPVSVMAQQTDIVSLFPENEVVPMLLSARPSTPRYGQTSADKPLTILHCTDVHGSKDNLARIVEFADAYGEYVDEVVHSGDAVICYWDDENIFETVPGARKILNTIGNHDCWKGHLVWAQTEKPYDASEQDAFEKFFAGSANGKRIVDEWGVTLSDNPYGCYYHKDYPDSKIRLVVLDCMHYTVAQNKWFIRTLDQAREKGYAVVGVTHYPSSSGLIPIESGFTSFNREIPASDTTRVQYESMSEAAFNSVDQFVNAGGQFVCWLSGHTHSDYMGMVKGHETQLQVILDKSGDMDTYMREDRTKGTRNQDAFNLTTINPSRGLLTIYRIGCRRGADMRSKELFVYDYIHNRVVLSE